jgi:nitrite reductase/ring-hydroxylating ferredoxin subunit
MSDGSREMSKGVSLPVLTPDGRPWNQQPAWRHDFPIDVPQDNYVARRDFTKFMVLTSFAFVVGQAWIGIVSARRRRGRKPDARRIAAIADVPVGGALTFNYPETDDACLLLRTADNGFVAYGAKCTHLSCAVLPDVAAGVLRCPCHQGLFDLATGRPIAGPPRRPLPRIQIEVRNGNLYATEVED